MRIQVITDGKGKVVGGMRIETLEIDGRPASVSLAPERGQTIHEVDVPDELQQAQDASAFLAEVAKRLRPAKRKR